MTIIGIDIGGTGIKGAPVDTRNGKLTTERNRLPTPDHPTPKHVLEISAKIIDDLGGMKTLRPSAIGVGFPGVITGGAVRTAAHLDTSWVDTNAVSLFADHFGVPTTVINDADAAGLAEVRFGAGKGVDGVVLMLTFGTGVGCGLYHNGVLVPNAQLGHLEVDGHDAETRVAASVRESENMSWHDWGKKLDRYLEVIEELLWPDLIIIGGGVSEKFDKFEDRIHRHAKVVAASLGNDAGILGAALWAAEHSAS
jgi:polyphosphate glucokinase